MKKIIAAVIILSILLALEGCSNKGGKKGSDGDSDSSAVADTGYTGIKQYYSKSSLTYEVTFKNGVRQGIMKTYYPTGKLRQTFWYENGMREDTAVWYYEDGTIFRKTPFKRDSINGTQIQYYKSGKVRAKLGFVDGLRTPFLEEFTSDGKKITDYPSVVVRTDDNYNLNGTFQIFVELDRQGVKSNFYRGDFVDGLFMPKKLKKINSSETTGFIKLEKTGTQGPGYVGIISEIMTSLGNRHLVYKRVELPHKDLN
jgi:hypothetical protein